MKPLKQQVDLRHESRKLVLQALFEASFHQCDLIATAKRIRADMLLDLLDEELLHFLLEGIPANLNEIDIMISRCAPEWPLKQLPKIDLNILRIAIFELYFAKSVPPKVAIDEGVELAKEFSSDTGSSFVNGALGTIIKLRERELDTETALFLGHFQPLHKGHTKALRQIASRFPKVTIGVIDSDQKHTAHNPLSWDERREMLEDVLSTLSLKEDEREADVEPIKATFKIVGLKTIENQEEWLRHVKELCQPFAVVYTNDDKLTELFEMAKIPVFHAQLIDETELSSTNIRRCMVLGQPWSRLVPIKVERYLRRRKLLERIHNLAVASS